jgi:hypothetical protein
MLECRTPALYVERQHSKDRMSSDLSVHVHLICLLCCRCLEQVAMRPRLLLALRSCSSWQHGWQLTMPMQPALQRRAQQLGMSRGPSCSSCWHGGCSASKQWLQKFSGCRLQAQLYTTKPGEHVKVCAVHMQCLVFQAML